MDIIQFFVVMTFEMVALLVVCRLVENIYDDLTILIFNEDV